MRVKIFQQADSNWDQFIGSTDVIMQTKIRESLAYIRAWSPYFETNLKALPWMPSALVYLDSYGIYANDPIAKSHPEWIAKDITGNPLYLASTSQYCGDISNVAFRNYKAAQAKILLNGFGSPYGYRGLWLDDVNMQITSQQASGISATPVDSNTGKPITLEAWQSCMLTLVASVRAALPVSALVVHNPVWYVPDSSNIEKQISLCDIIWCERGYGDTNLTGGQGGTFRGFMEYVDRVHSRGASVVMGNYTTDNQLFKLAGYFLTNNGSDYYSCAAQTPATWTESLYVIDLGAPVSERYVWNTVWRRDFQKGIVLLNEPDAPTTTMPLPPGMSDTAGRLAGSVTLNSSQGGIFLYK